MSAHAARLYLLLATGERRAAVDCACELVYDADREDAQAITEVCRTLSVAVTPRPHADAHPRWDYAHPLDLILLQTVAELWPRARARDCLVITPAPASLQLWWTDETLMARPLDALERLLIASSAPA